MEKEIILPDGGFITTTNETAWYEVYKIGIDNDAREITFYDEWGYARGLLREFDKEEYIEINHYEGDALPENHSRYEVLVLNGKLVI